MVRCLRVSRSLFSTWGAIGAVLVGKKISAVARVFLDPPSLFRPFWAILGQARPF
jgi:hypothetical protein